MRAFGKSVHNFQDIEVIHFLLFRVKYLRISGLE